MKQYVMFIKESGMLTDGEVALHANSIESVSQYEPNDFDVVQSLIHMKSGTSHVVIGGLESIFTQIRTALGED